MARYTAPPELMIDPSKNYTATIKTNKGDMVLALTADKTPVTVNNFVFLAGEGYYDGVTFHRVIPDFMVRWPKLIKVSTKENDYQFGDEFDSSLTHDGPGVLSMANAGPGTNGSQFFITHVATPWLDGKHSVFGRLIEGEDVLFAIRQGDIIETIVIDED